MIEAENKSEDDTVESILSKIGQIRIDPSSLFVGPFKSDDENEVWIRQKALQLRHIYERYPNHEAALSCLVQLSSIEFNQPRLFASTIDPLNATVFKPTGFYCHPDPTNMHWVQDRNEASAPIDTRLDERARSILERHPDLGIAEWAYQRSIRQQGSRLFSSGRTIEQTVCTIDELCQTVRDYLDYRRKDPACIEPHDGYFDFGSIQAVDFLIQAIDELEPKGRTAQFALLKRVSQMFPDNEDIANYTYKFNSFEKPFELSFTDLLSGDHVDITDFRGKVVIIDFWATWCQPCLMYVPFLKEVVAKYPRDVKVIGISCDDDDLDDESTLEQRKALESVVLECASKHNMDWPIFLSSRLHEKWCIKGIPTAFVIDRRGILRALDAQSALLKTVQNIVEE